MAQPPQDQPVHDDMLGALVGLVAAGAIWMMAGGELLDHTGAWLAVLVLLLAGGAGLALQMLSGGEAH